MSKQLMLLDVGQETWEFIMTISGIDGLVGMFDDENFLSLDILRTILEYMADRDTAYGSLLAYVKETSSTYGAWCDEEELELLESAIRAIGIAIFLELQRVGAYDKHGALWYQLHSICGNDLVLERLNPFEIQIPKTKQLKLF